MEGVVIILSDPSGVLETRVGSPVVTCNNTFHRLVMGAWRHISDDGVPVPSSSWCPL